MYIIKLEKLDELMSLTDDLVALAYLRSLVCEDRICIEHKPQKKVAESAEMYLEDLNEQTLKKLYSLIMSENFATAPKILKAKKSKKYKK